MATLRTETRGASAGAPSPERVTRGRTLKYVLDRLVGGLSLLFTAPIIALIALVLLATRTRPLLQVDYRLGEHGRMVALRSFAITEQQLRKRRWRLLVASGATALPQLWNVVRGDLSLVGPRPRELGLEPPPVRPGLTGLAQLHQLDGWLALADQRQLDDEYARTWSLGLDARIAWRTILRTLR
jgi:lipopolysaccharide/colanic/teichoic acid biosynthesis glycosyltransferase